MVEYARHREYRIDHSVPMGKLYYYKTRMSCNGGPWVDAVQRIREVDLSEVLARAASYAGADKHDYIIDMKTRRCFYLSGACEEMAEFCKKQMELAVEGYGDAGPIELVEGKLIDCKALMCALLDSYCSGKELDECGKENEE